jgi:hypothetical protein
LGGTGLDLGDPRSLSAAFAAICSSAFAVASARPAWISARVSSAMRCASARASASALL